MTQMIKSMFLFTMTIFLSQTSLATPTHPTTTNPAYNDSLPNLQDLINELLSETFPYNPDGTLQLPEFEVDMEYDESIIHQILDAIDLPKSEIVNAWEAKLRDYKERWGE
jgi:hypothetical protein